MTRHLDREIERLKEGVLGLSALVEESVYRAIRAVEECDPALAQLVIDEDTTIDQREVLVEEECLKILALYQPVAIDLRFLVAILKLNSDLERIGDLAGNIASRAKGLAALPRPTEPIDFGPMFAAAKGMLRGALASLVELDTKRALEVIRSDEALDDLNRANYRAIKQLIKDNPNDLDPLLHYLSVSRNLERIGDHCTNIAEDVVYMMEGKIVRHRVDEAW
jgi:phosphate transport system protein